MKIDIQQLAKQAMIKIPKEQEQFYENQLNEMISMVGNLPDLKSDQPLLDLENKMKLREDVSSNEFTRKELLKNAPQQQAGCVVVPNVME